jgi:hypothetical protein
VNTPPVPDVKDWTWVLERQCPDCGFDTRGPTRAQLPDLARDVGDRWVRSLAAIDAASQRPAPATWSPLEYACHVRDVFALATYRVDLMLREHDPVFANWDQDETALAQDYASQDPHVVSTQLAREADAHARLLTSVPDDSWDRPGRRGDGASFTVESFARYLLHDPIHHLTDVTGRAWS